MTDEQYLPESLLTVEETAVRLGLDSATIRALMRAGHLPKAQGVRRAMVPARALIEIHAAQARGASLASEPVAIVEDDHDLNRLGTGLYQLRWPNTRRLVRVEPTVFDFATDETRFNVPCVRLARVMFPRGLTPKGVEAFWQRRDGLTVVIAKCQVEHYPGATRDDLQPAETVDPAVPHLEPPVATPPKRKSAPKRRPRKAR